MLRVLKQAFKTGVLTNKFPAVRSGPPVGFQGKPVIDFARCTTGDICADACPSGALSFETRKKDFDTGKWNAELTLDYGKCIFCGECTLASPESITVAAELPPATTNKANLTSRAKYKKNKRKQWELVECVATPAPPRQTTDNAASLKVLGRSVQEAVHRIFGRSLHIREVDAGSCNGCEIEITSLNNPLYDVERFGIHFVASPRHADMLLVTGPVTRNMEIALRQTYDATPNPKLVIAVGACGISGGIFGQSYASCGGVDTVVPVDVYIPGCPPGPEALLRGILLALRRWPQQI
jgi:Ni,Fe-hydrogenase III small subunit/formate hydrogenlyase subunit 6/NADH:ubiquinone oxidoreductase subunit I